MHFQHAGHDELGSINRHQIMLATLSCGLVFALNQTSIRFSWKQPFSPWHVLLRPLLVMREPFPPVGVGSQFEFLIGLLGLRMCKESTCMWADAQPLLWIGSVCPWRGRLSSCMAASRAFEDQGWEGVWSGETRGFGKIGISLRRVIKQAGQDIAVILVSPRILSADLEVRLSFVRRNLQRIRVRRLG